MGWVYPQYKDFRPWHIWKIFMSLIMNICLKQKVMWRSVFFQKRDHQLVKNCCFRDRWFGALGSGYPFPESLSPFHKSGSLGIQSTNFWSTLIDVECFFRNKKIQGKHIKIGEDDCSGWSSSVIHMFLFKHMGVSKNGTPKWMVCNGKPY